MTVRHQSSTDVEFQEQKQSHEIILSWQHIGFCFEAVDVENAYRDHTRFIAHENLLPVSRVSFLVAVASLILQVTIRSLSHIHTADFSERVLSRIQSTCFNETVVANARSQSRLQLPER